MGADTLDLVGVACGTAAVPGNDGPPVTAQALTRREPAPVIDGAGILLSSTRALLSNLERYDDEVFIACLCPPLLGDDLARHPPR